MTLSQWAKARVHKDFEANLQIYQVGAHFEALNERVLMASSDARYTQVLFNLFSVQACTRTSGLVPEHGSGGMYLQQSSRVGGSRSVGPGSVLDVDDLPVLLAQAGAGTALRHVQLTDHVVGRLLDIVKLDFQVVESPHST